LQGKEDWAPGELGISSGLWKKTARIDVHKRRGGERKIKWERSKHKESPGQV